MNWLWYKCAVYLLTTDIRRVWRYQRCNQNPSIEEQIAQWPEEKVQKDKQQSTKHTHKAKDRTPLKTGDELKYPGRVSSSCSTSGTRRLNLVSIASPNWDLLTLCWRQRSDICWLCPNLSPPSHVVFVVIIILLFFLWFCWNWFSYVKLTRREIYFI